MTDVNKVWAVVPAAGIGSRMRQAIAKQYLPIAGKAVIEHTLNTLLTCERVDGVVVCVAHDDNQFQQLEIAQHPKLRLTKGGATRAASVMNGLSALEKTLSSHDWVLVHDAARPCLKLSTLNKLIEQLLIDDTGGILAVPAQDTLKRAHTETQAVAETLDRSRIWQAQTPQMFRYQRLFDALRTALHENIEITDEASALEWCGYKVKLIHGDAQNIKITTPEDLALAEYLLASEKRAL